MRASACVAGLWLALSAFGESLTEDGNTHAFTWQNDVMTDLGTLGGGCSVAWADLPSLGGKYSDADDINRDGWIVGLSRTASGGPFATLWRPK